MAAPAWDVRINKMPTFEDIEDEIIPNEKKRGPKPERETWDDEDEDFHVQSNRHERQLNSRPNNKQVGKKGPDKKFRIRNQL